jgi:AcrR family transcriptional regulator
VGRKAGSTAEDTRAELLRAAAKVFARKGFEGASIADITAEAGLSSGPIYLHFGGKAELFAAVLDAHADAALDRVLGQVDRHDVTAVLETLGSDLSRKDGDSERLLIEAVTAARHDPVVATMLQQHFRHRQELLAGLIADGQRSGEIDPRVSAETVARFAAIVGLGSHVMRLVDPATPDPDEWSDLIHGVVRSLRARPLAADVAGASQ